MVQQMTRPKDLLLEERYESVVDHISTRAMRSTRGFFTDVSYFNLTGREIRIKDRLQVTRVIPDGSHKLPVDMLDFYGNKRIILIELTFNMSMESLLPALEELKQTKDHSYLCKKIYQAVERMAYDRHTGNNTILFEIPLISIVKVGGVVYLPELDVTIEAGLDGELPLSHPACPKEKYKLDNNQLALDLVAINNEASVVAIEAIDNTGHRSIADKYIAIAGTVYKVPIRRDKHSSHHGVRVRRKGAIIDSENSSGMVMEDMSFEDAKIKIGLSDTIEEAKYFGDTKEKVSGETASELLRVKESENELRLKRLAFEHAKLEHEREEKVREHLRQGEKERIDLENKRLEQTMLDQKRMLDQMRFTLENNKMSQSIKSESLKTFLDVFKNIAAVVGTVVALTSTFSKILETFAKAKVV